MVDTGVLVEMEHVVKKVNFYSQIRVKRLNGMPHMLCFLRHKCTALCAWRLLLGRGGG
jgi:hypothetical protein